MTQRRAGEWLARLGVLVIHNDPVPETELWAMAPPGVSVHAARFESPTRSGAEYTGSPWRAMVESPDVARGLDHLGQVGLEAICLCFGSCSFFGGTGFDDGFTTAAAPLAHGTPVFTAAQAMIAALRAGGVRRPLLVMPPWFTAPTFEAAERYLAEAGLAAAGRFQFDLGPDWDGEHRHLLFDRGGRWSVQPHEVARQVRASFPPTADGVLVPGSGFRSLESIEPLESALGVPVVTSNQACLWHFLCIARVAAGPVPGGGRLFTAWTDA